MSFSKFTSADWYKNYNNWLPWAQWLGGIIVVIFLAKIFWLWALYFTMPSEFKPIKVMPANSASSTRSIDISKVVNMNLFGAIIEQVVEVKPVVENVVETSLNLKLRGIYAADTVEKANAIIEDDRGKQEVYFIGEKLKVSGRVYLRQVYADRVILETNGRRESLTLEQPELVIKTTSSPYSKAPPSLPTKDSPRRTKVDDKRKDDRLTEKLSEYRNKLSSDPQSVADIISGQPHYVNGELQGFRIQPGKDKRLFQELGLRRNDIVTSINGVGLTNIQDAMRLMGDMQSFKEMSVEIQRGNQQLNILVNLNQNVGRK
ncbi:type II secretion system protein GspC [Aliikangiella maris]|uniref:Type II secretion system protein GspC n=2 Tax=Aliikangiella maris TaxID=3162458 RepID=A0ABV3MTD9_9GAMM